jgi:hypothetical protein
VITNSLLISRSLVIIIMFLLDFSFRPPEFTCEAVRFYLRTKSSAIRKKLGRVSFILWIRENREDTKREIKKNYLKGAAKLQ